MSNVKAKSTMTQLRKDNLKLRQYVWVLLGIVGAFALKYWRVI
jgi:hypothetical protein